MAAAGVDASNTPAGTVLLLPEDPDASARAIRDGLRDTLGVDVGVVVTDTFGRPWRNGLTDVAIGAAGVRVLDDLRGGTDAHGNPLSATVVATADELAAAGDLVKGKAAGLPVAVVRGLAARGRPRTTATGARALVRGAARRHVPAGHLGGRTGGGDPAAYGTGVHRRAGGPGRGAAGGGRGGDRAGAASHDAVAVRAAGVRASRGRGCWTRCGTPGSRICGGDGKTEESIAKRVRRGDVLRNAPYLVVPCLVMDGSHTLRGRAAGRGRAGDVRGRGGRRACRTSWSRWPGSGWGRRGCPRRCSAGTWCGRCWGCRGLGSDGGGGGGACGGGARARAARDAEAFIEVR